MGLADIVRSGIAVANTLTETLQATVTHEAWIGNKTDGYAGPRYAEGIARAALVDQTRKLRRLSNGEEVVQQASITFLTPIAANGATNRREPVDPRDRFTLPDGKTGPILDVIGGLVDPSTNAPYMLEVILGA